MRLQLPAVIVARVSASATDVMAQLLAVNLQLWLWANSLKLAQVAQMTTWIDSSSYGITFSPRTGTEADGAIGSFKFASQVRGHCRLPFPLIWQPRVDGFIKTLCVAPDHRGPRPASAVAAPVAESGAGASIRPAAAAISIGLI